MLWIRIDGTTIPALLFGSLLVVAACVMGLLVWRARRGLDPQIEHDPPARLHADRQFRRRLQVSVMLGIVGILIPLGDQLETFFANRPVLFLGWVCAVLFLVAWMVLMAIGDWMSTMTYSAVAKSRLRYERRELEAEIRRYHAETNGHPLDGA